LAVEEVPPSPSRTLSILLLTALIVGQFAWSLVAPAESRRFVWLWPIQCLLAAFALGELGRSLAWRRVSQTAVAVVLILSFAVPAATSRVRDWRTGGRWEGQDGPVIRLLDQLARHQQSTFPAANGRVSVSYAIPGEPFMLAANSVDRRYTLGLGYDLYLRFKHSLRQEVTCADTYDKSSRYVIRADRPNAQYAERPEPLVYHPALVDSSQYVLLGQEGSLSLLWRP
jgi:hypothetical protein